MVIRKLAYIPSLGPGAALPTFWLFWFIPRGRMVDSSPEADFIQRTPSACFTSGTNSVTNCGYQPSYPYLEYLEEVKTATVRYVAQ